MGTIKFGSFPRSGSHFFIHLTNCEWLDHKIEPLDKEKNVVVTIRNPIECIPSWITLTEDKRDDRAERVMEWYCAYYSKCLVSDLVIIPFDQLIKEPMKCIEHIEDTYEIKIQPINKYDLATDFHYPTKNKNGFSPIIDEMKQAPSFDFAMELFKALCAPVG